MNEIIKVIRMQIRRLTDLPETMIINTVIRDLENVIPEIDELIMSDMTHEFNEAEGIKYWPAHLEQIKEEERKKIFSLQEVLSVVRTLNDGTNGHDAKNYLNNELHILLKNKKYE